MMADREKVIKGLRCRAYDDEITCEECGYFKPDEKPVSKCDYYRIFDDAIDLLNEQPQIVRCGDCIHGRLVGSGFCECRRDGNAHYHDWFCADGEVKRNEPD